MLHTPILYVSYFLKKNQWEYYGKLANVRDTGNYEQWVLFFLEAVNAAAQDAIQTINALKRIQEAGLAKIKEIARPGGTAEQVFRKLASHPIISTKSLAATLGISRNTASKYIMSLTRLGILAETTNRARNRVFAYSEYLDILRKDT